MKQAVSGSTSTRSSRTEEETQAVNYLFGLMAVVFGDKKMSVTYPDSMLIATKSMSAPQIAGLSKGQIDKGIAFIKSEREKGNPEFEWPNLDRIVGAIKEANRHRPLHQMYEKPAALIGHDKTKANEAAAKHLADLKSIFN